MNCTQQIQVRISTHLAVDNDVSDFCLLLFLHLDFGREKFRPLLLTPCAGNFVRDEAIPKHGRRYMDTILPRKFDYEMAVSIHRMTRNDDSTYLYISSRQ